MNRLSKTLTVVAAFMAAATTLSCSSEVEEQKNYYVDIKSRAQLHEWFDYAPDRDIVISGHRGGMLAGYPENSIECFEKTLTIMPSFFEIDPRLTKDGVIVLIHDATLDRTTTGSGKVADYTYEELQKFNLKDEFGTVTEFKIPTLAEAIEWSQGKCILNLDIKDVPIPYMSKFINAINPPNVMYTVRNADQARQYLDADPDAMFSCWCKTMDEYEKYEAAEIPWNQMMTYIGPRVMAERQELYDKLHANGVMCMISVAPTHDKLDDEQARIAEYRKEMVSGCDVIESDYPYLFQSISTKR